MAPRRPDLCPACNALVRFDWTDHCGACGALLVPEDPHDGKADPSVPTSAGHHWLIMAGAGAVALVICIIGFQLTQAKPEASDATADAPTLAQLTSAAPTTSTTANPSAPTTAAPTTTTTVPQTPAGFLAAAAAKTSSGSTFTFTTSMTSSVAGNVMKETGKYNGSTQMCDLTFTVGPTSGEVILDNAKHVTYTKTSDTTSANPAKPWIESTNLANIPIDSADPTGGLAFVQNAGPNVKNLGAATINGTATTHYQATISPATLQSSASTSTAELLSKYPNLSVTADVYIDSSTNIRRVIVKMDTGDSTVGTITLTEDVSGIGLAVPINAPSASLVTMDGGQGL